MDVTIHRTIDSLGRLQLPATIRRALYGDVEAAGVGKEVNLDVVNGELRVTPVDCTDHPPKGRRT